MMKTPLLMATPYRKMPQNQRVDDRGRYGIRAKIHDYLESLPEVGKVQSLATLYKVGKDINGSLNNFELALMEKSLPESVSRVLFNPYLDKTTDQTLHYPAGKRFLPRS